MNTRPRPNKTCHISQASFDRFLGTPVANATPVVAGMAPLISRVTASAPVREVSVKRTMNAAPQYHPIVLRPSEQAFPPLAPQGKRKAPASFRRKRSEKWRMDMEQKAQARRGKISDRTRLEAAEAEGARNSKGSSIDNAGCKYSRLDVLQLKECFDEYDADGDGLITQNELRRALQKRKADAQHYDGRPKTLKERQRAAGIITGQHLKQRNAVKDIFLVDHASSMFRALDQDGSESIEFVELLRLVFPRASDSDFATMARWTREEDPFIEEERAGLSKQAMNQISSVFRMYDEDKDGFLTATELGAASGLDDRDAEDLVGQHDRNDDGKLDEEEFMDFMASTGAFCEP